MADLSVNLAGIKSPNPFWLASAPPTNSAEQCLRAFDFGWGGVVWKTVGDPIVNVSSRLGSIDASGIRMVGLNNIELITDRPLSENLREIREVKKRFPDRAVVVSIMAESKEDWRELIRRSEDTGCDGLELNFGCPHGMCERGMGSAVGQEPKVIREITAWAREFASTPVIVKLTPNISDIIEPGRAATEGGAHALSLINTIKSLTGVDLDNFVPYPVVGGQSTPGGFCGPAVKPIALHMVSALAKDSQINIPISAIGGISTWRDAAEFMALGATNVQICTAVMHYGYRIIEQLTDGLSNYLDEHGMASANELIGRAVPAVVDWGDLNLNYKVVADIDLEKCIGCQLCIPACQDGAHQCIYPPGVEAKPGHTAPHAAEAAEKLAEDPIYRVPWVDETDCVGCNLCAHVCPVPDCITMKQVETTKPRESWNDRIAKGIDFIPGGLHDSPAS